MRVRITTSIAGPGGSYRRGQLATIDEPTALEWINLGMAEAIQDEPAMETAEAPRYETATMPARSKKGRRA